MVCTGTDDEELDRRQETSVKEEGAFSLLLPLTTSEGLDMYIGGVIIQTYAGYGTEPISLLGSFKI